MKMNLGKGRRAVLETTGSDIMTFWKGQSTSKGCNRKLSVSRLRVSFVAKIRVSLCLTAGFAHLKNQ